MRYTVRLRQVVVHEFVLDAPTLKDAFSTAMEKACNDKLPEDSAVGLFYELESITLGGTNDSKPKRKQNRGSPPISSSSREGVEV